MKEMKQEWDEEHKGYCLNIQEHICMWVKKIHNNSGTQEFISWFYM